MFRLLAIMFIGFSIFVQSAFGAQEPVFEKIEKDELTYFKMDNCPYKFGVASMFYARRNFVNDITDVCFDEAGGRLWSSEGIENLTLVSKDSKGLRYEDLDSAGEGEERTFITLTKPWRDNELCGPQKVEYHELQGAISGNSAKSNRPSIGQSSYLIARSYTAHKNLEFGNGFINVESPEVIDGKRAFKFEGEPLYGLSYDKTKAVFDSDGIGRIEIQNNPAPGIAESFGTIELAGTGDGKLRGSGEITVKSSRLAGFRPNEWKEATLQFVGLRGHVYGDKGQYLSLIGWVKGSFIDAENDTHTFLANTQISNCRTEE